MENIKTNQLNQDEKNLLCSIINNLGSGEHPCADERTLSGFRKEYVNELLISAESKLNEKGLSVLQGIKAKI